jgi:hypothetical protein
VRLFRGINQQKEERERARSNCALLDAESVDLAEQVIEGRGVGVPVPSGARGDAQAFDDRERLLSFEPPDYTPQRSCEPAYVIVEGQIFFSWSGRGGHGVNDTA